MKNIKVPTALLIVILSLIASYANAQKISEVPPVYITPVHTFLQRSADTTLLFSLESNFVSTPRYLMLSKKGDTVTLYKYESGFNKNLMVPTKIRDSLYKLNRPQESFNIGINRFFNVVNIDQDTAKAFWSKVSGLRPFQIKDDSVDGEGCHKTNIGNNNNIYDGGGISLYLITKNEIKRLYFYSPVYYEQLCPGRPGRQAIIKIKEQFFANFGE